MVIKTLAALLNTLCVAKYVSSLATMNKTLQHLKISLLSKSEHHECQHQTELVFHPNLPLFAKMTVPLQHMVCMYVIICIKVIKMWQE